MAKKFVTKDSGKRQEYNSGMRRDLQEGKPRFDLINPVDMPYEETLMYRWAMLFERGMQKYGYRNWELADSQEELNRFKASAWRHFVQALQGEEDEDHYAATLFNLNAIIYLQWKLKMKEIESQ
jgi:hypothetical protein